MFSHPSQKNKAFSPALPKETVAAMPTRSRRAIASQGRAWVPHSQYRKLGEISVVIFERCYKSLPHSHKTNLSSALAENLNDACLRMQSFTCLDNMLKQALIIRYKSKKGAGSRRTACEFSSAKLLRSRSYSS